MTPQKARSLLSYAVASGKVERRPCEVCGNPVSEAHHDDYGRPLDVAWLCRPHHAEQHRMASRLENEIEAAAAEIGISRANIAKWRQRGIPYKWRLELYPRFSIEQLNSFHGAAA